MRRSAGLAAIASANIAAAFFYNWYLVAVLGPGRETDALFAAMIVPQVMLVVGGTALGNVLIPLLAVQAGTRVSELVWTLFQVVLIYAGLIAGLLAVTAPWWVPLTVPGFAPGERHLVSELAAIQLAGAVLTVAAAVQRSAYNARHRFVWPELSSLVSTALGLGCLALALPRYGVVGAAWVTVLRAAAQMAFLFRGMGPYQRPLLAAAELRDAWRRLRPLLFGALYFKSDFVVDRLLASMAPPGALSLFSLAQQGYSAAQLVLGKALAAPAVPQLAQAAEAGQWRRFRRISRRRLVFLLGFALFGYLGVLLVGRPVLALTFERGKFTAEAVHQLWWLFVALGGVWFGSVAGQIIATSFYTQGDTRTPMIIGAATFTVAIGLKLGGFFAFGIMGLAVAATLYYLSSAGIQWVILERRLRQLTGSGPAGD